MRVDIRVIATTNCALSQMVRGGKFRADLYYRLNVIPLSLPPLRATCRRRSRTCRSICLLWYASQGKVFRFTDEFVHLLERHSWPGNVRELANCVHRAVALSSGLNIDVGVLEDVDWVAGGPSLAGPSRHFADSGSASGSFPGRNGNASWSKSR